MRYVHLFTPLLLCLWIFSIPWSLAYHFNKTAGLVNGILVDYRIPTISASAIFLVFFLVSFFISKKRNRMQLCKTASVALAFTLIFQAALALLQVSLQRSIFGYIPMGEVSYTRPQIAKGVLFTGQLYKLPYGSTVHPNVLAGFAVISFLLLLTQKQTQGKHIYFIFFLIAGLTCILAQSLTALSALIVGCLVYVVIKKKKKMTIHTLRLLIVLIPIFSFLLFSLRGWETSQNTSFSRRAQLQRIAVSMIQSHPTLGVGWNNFTLYEEQYGYVPGSIRFLQPVHNAFLLLATELGVVGWGINVFIALIVWKTNAKYLPLISAFIVISSLDHYVATLTTGRMLLGLALFFYYIKRLSRDKEV